MLISTESVEEKIESKEAKNEKDVSKEEQRANDKSIEEKDNTAVEEEIQGDNNNNDVEQEDQGDINASRSDAKSHKNEEQGDQPIEEAISNMESRRSKGDPSPSKILM